MTRRDYRSLQAIGWADEQRTGDSAANALLNAIARLVSDKEMGGFPPLHCWASNEQLSEKTQLNIKTVEKHMRGLVAQGYLEPVSTHGKTGRITVYRLSINAPKFGATEEHSDSTSHPFFPPNPPKSGNSLYGVEKVIKKRERTLPQSLNPASKKRPCSVSTGLVTFATYRQRLKAAGEKFLADDDSIYEYAEGVGIDSEMFATHAHRFVQVYTVERDAKKYTDWRKVFRNSVRGNWFGLWFVEPGSGKFNLTSKGLQAQASFRSSQALARQGGNASRALPSHPGDEGDAVATGHAERATPAGDTGDTGGDARSPMSGLRERIAEQSHSRLLSLRGADGMLHQAGCSHDW